MLPYLDDDGRRSRRQTGQHTLRRRQIKFKCKSFGINRGDGVNRGQVWQLDRDWRHWRRADWRHACGVNGSEWRRRMGSESCTSPQCINSDVSRGGTADCARDTGRGSFAVRVGWTEDNWWTRHWRGDGITLPTDGRTHVAHARSRNAALTSLGFQSSSLSPSSKWSVRVPPADASYHVIRIRPMTERFRAVNVLSANRVGWSSDGGELRWRLVVMFGPFVIPVGGGGRSPTE